jgi:membrane carboxypeptidase/penicillin-binding protein PbpC
MCKNTFLKKLFLVVIFVWTSHATVYVHLARCKTSEDFYAFQGSLLFVTRTRDGAWTSANQLERTRAGAWTSVNKLERTRDGAWTSVNKLERTRDGAWTSANRWSEQWMEHGCLRISWSEPQNTF